MSVLRLTNLAEQKYVLRILKDARVFWRKYVTLDEVQQHRLVSERNNELARLTEAINYMEGGLDD